MIWLEEENFEPKVKRAVGRPMESPFCSAESEREFIRCGKAMLEQYYRPGGENTRKDFVFNKEYALSKTSFWSFIYIYYVSEKHMQDNLQGFLSIIRLNFGDKVSSERTTLSKSLKMLEGLSVQFKHSMYGTTPSMQRAQDTQRSHYQYVVKRWKACCEALKEDL